MGEVVVHKSGILSWRKFFYYHYNLHVLLLQISDNLVITHAIYGRIGLLSHLRIR